MTEEKITLTEDELELAKTCAKIKELKLRIESIKSELATLEDSIKTRMSNEELTELKVGCFKISYKDVSKTNFDSKTFKQDHADLYEQYANTTTYKRFEIR